MAINSLGQSVDRVHNTRHFSHNLIRERHTVHEDGVVDDILYYESSMVLSRYKGIRFEPHLGFDTPEHQPNSFMVKYTPRRFSNLFVF